MSGGLLGRIFAREAEADRVVPPSGFTVWLTVGSAAAMAALAVFALTLSVATARLAERWEVALAETATVRISAPADQMEAQIAAVMRVLGQTPGVAEARLVTAEEQARLLAPWFGPGLPIEALPVPRLVEVTEAPGGFDAEGLRLRLSAEAPGAVLDDHARWRRPLVEAAGRVRALGLAALVLIGGAMAGMVTLAARTALAANAEVITVLRLVGAEDGFIAGAFVRRFTIRALAGALLGTLAATLAIALLPSAEAAGVLTGIGFQGAGWAWPLAVPPATAIVAWGATRGAARSQLRRIT